MATLLTVKEELIVPRKKKEVYCGGARVANIPGV